MQFKNLARFLKQLGHNPLLPSNASKTHWLFGANILQKKTMLQRGFCIHRKPDLNTQETNKFSSQSIIQEPLTSNTFHDPTAVPTQSEKSANDHVKEDIGLNKFLAKIYGVTGLSFASSLGLSYALAVSPLTIPAMPAILGGLALSMGGVFALDKIKPIIRYEKGSEGKIKEIWENPLSRKLAFCTMVGGMGLMTVPMTTLVLGLSPMILPTAAGLSIMVMGGSSLYALSRPLGHFTPWKGVLYGGLLTFVGIQFMSLGLTFAIGPNLFSAAFSTVYPYIGLCLFSGLQAYDTQKAILDYKKGQYDHLMHATDFFLNIKNIFVEITSAIVDFISNIFN